MTTQEIANMLNASYVKAETSCQIEDYREAAKVSRMLVKSLAKDLVIEDNWAEEFMKRQGGEESE